MNVSVLFAMYFAKMNFCVLFAMYFTIMIFHVLLMNFSVCYCLGSLLQSLFEATDDDGSSVVEGNRIASNIELDWTFLLYQSTISKNFYLATSSIYIWFPKCLSNIALTTKNVLIGLVYALMAPVITGSSKETVWKSF